jgi:hypothetical protein
MGSPHRSEHQKRLRGAQPALAAAHAMCEYLTDTTFSPTSRSATPQLLRASFKRNQIMFMNKNDILNLYVV